MDFDFFIGLADRSPGIVALAGFWWFVRYKASAWDKHVEECSKIPKGLIMDKLEVMHDGLTALTAAQTQMSKDVNQLIGRQIERDKA